MVYSHVVAMQLSGTTVSLMQTLDDVHMYVAGKPLYGTQALLSPLCQ